MGAVDSLFLKLGVQVDQASLSQSLGALKMFAGSASALFTSFKATTFLTEMAKVGADIDDTSQRFGVSTGEIQRFGYALQMSGVDADSAGQTFKFLQKNLQGAATGAGPAADALRELGVNAADAQKQDFHTNLLQIADGFQKLGAGGKATNASLALFGRAGADIIPLLTQGADGVNQLYTEADALGGILGDEFVKNAAKADDELDRMGFVWEGLKGAIAQDALPMFTEVVKKLLEGTKAIKDFVKETNISKYLVPAAFAAAAVSVALFAVQAAKVVGIIKEGMTIVESLGAVLGAAWPVALIVAVGLALEDVYVWLTGGDSVIGGLLDKWFGFEKAVQITNDVKAGLVQMWEWIKNIGLAIYQSFVPAIESLGTAFKELGLGELMDTLFGKTDGFLGAVQGFFSFMGKVTTFLFKTFALLIDSVGRLITLLAGAGQLMAAVASGKGLSELGAIASRTWDLANKPLTEAQNPLNFNAAPAAATSFTPQGPTLDQVGNSYAAGTLAQTNNITINGATDPKATAAAVRGAVDASNRTALAARGVAQ